MNTTRHSSRLTVVEAKEEPMTTLWRTKYVQSSSQLAAVPLGQCTLLPADCPEPQKSRDVDILYRCPSHWLNNKALKLYFKRRLSNFATCFWILELLEHLTLLGSYSSLQLRRKKRPIAMLGDDFNALLRADFLWLNYIVFSKSQVLQFATQTPPTATSNFWLFG